MNIDFIRIERDRMLKATDKYMISDWPISANEKNDWVTYRQALRDITNLTDFSKENDFWPIPPKRYTCDGGYSINLPLNYVDKY
jgi:hypothetical protein